VKSCNKYLYLPRSLCEQYDNDPDITSLLRRMEIHLIPSVNPDGFVLKTRNNAHDKDLNRSFPDWADLGQELSTDCREPEVAAVMNWMKKNYFVLSLDFHDGWSTVTFPWDDSPACTNCRNAVCSEDNTFYQLAATYACNHAYMHTGYIHCTIMLRLSKQFSVTIHAIQSQLLLVITAQMISRWWRVACRTITISSPTVWSSQ
jgi:hypothetical protein